jgi:SAM-dependent methyltransferase
MSELDPHDDRSRPGVARSTTSTVLECHDVHRFPDAGWSAQDDAVFSRIRLGLLLQALVGEAPLPDRSTVLDAGCGTGRFTRELAALGLAVHGIDADPAAIEVARGADDAATYEVATLAGVRPVRFFDAVVSVDVLYHLTDDDDWAASLTNLADVIRPGGTLVVSDTTAATRSRNGGDLVYRPHAEYGDLMAGRGFRPSGTWPYRFRGNPVGFHVFKRMW